MSLFAFTALMTRFGQQFPVFMFAHFLASFLDNTTQVNTPFLMLEESYYL
jgi:hypothetical protein